MGVGGGEGLVVVGEKPRDALGMRKRRSEWVGEKRMRGGAGERGEGGDYISCAGHSSLGSLILNA